ncbi:MAG: hypothetical protein EBY66_00440 [Candidatus Fonsibacter lacus]|jgi:hypothetical protein|nr:hypothetical protein [Candidatus Fonsibacter lacus]
MTTVNVSSVTNTVTVTENGSSTVVTVPVTSTVTAVTEGPQGPAGGTAFVYQQTAPATTWTINHNLGYKPSVELLDSGSQEIDGDVSHPSDNQTVVTLNPASAGLARLI